MPRLSLKEIIPSLSEMDYRELELVEELAKTFMRKKRSEQLSTDEELEEQLSVRASEGPGLSDRAKAVLEDSEHHDITLADQALLASVILSDCYQQDVFSSRDINDVIEECGRPRVAHITSAISGLTGRSFLTGSTKQLSLSREGRTKARGLLGMLSRRERAAS